MKTKWMIIPVMVIALACSRELETNTSYIEGEFTLYATSAEQETKTVLQSDGRIFWSPSDGINVFYGSKSGKFTSTNTKVAESAEFTGSLGAFTLDGTTEFVAAYPYSDQAGSSGNTLSLSLPAEQTAVEGTFADDLFICVAKSKNYNLHFYNVCGGVKFSLAKDGIKKVVFKGNKGEKLAGLLNVKFSSDGIPQVGGVSNGKTSITLVAPNGGTFKKGSWYYLVMAPQELSQGYTMEFYADQLVETESSDLSVSILRSNWGVLKDLISEEPVEFGAVDLGLSVKWANMNLGATRPEEYGDYYAWGETEPYYRSLDPIVWKSGKGSGYDWPSYTLSLGSSRTLTKYNFDSSYGNNGFTDGKTDLDLIDDAAHVKLGGKWRMPTLEEVNEFGSNCKWEKTTRNGVEGDLVTGPNGKSIFLPYAGYWDETSILDVGSLGVFWLPSLAVDETPNRAEVLLYDMSKTGTGSCDRCFGFPIRPVYGDITVESVSLNKTELVISVGDEATLTATVLPTNATNKNITWSSSNKSVVTVSSGIIKGVSIGSAIITVKTADGGKTATCSVTVKETSSSLPVPESIDLGLSVNWASFNVGASKPEEIGYFFAYGEIEPKEQYSWDNYKWYKDEGYYEGYTKYCLDASNGFKGYMDGKSVLDPEDDAAHVHLGGKWRMPTREELTELRENCTWTVKTINGQQGRLVTSKVNQNSIFLPFTGYKFGSVYTDLFQGWYWSSTTSYNDAIYLYITSSSVTVGLGERRDGQVIRPVCD